MMTANLAIVDSGGANIASLLYALERLNMSATLTSDAAVITSAERVILPGVGAAKDAMNRLREKNLLDVIRRLQQPVLGICLGMQLLAEASEEEDVDCLGIIPGTARKLPADSSVPVPNMGWCPIARTASHEVLDSMDDGSYFYFLHSYVLPVSDYTVATADHAEPFSAVVSHSNFVAAQFHPERSSVAGSRFLNSFLGLSS
jgi:glutamine amidotransferase